MNEKYKQQNRKKHNTLAPKFTVTNEDEETEQLGVVSQFKKVQQEQHQTLMEKLKQKYK